jgi:ABC-type uncharacterized transport system substrate-binding protein
MKLPTVCGYREPVVEGALISYGVNLNWCYRRAGYFIDKILHGAAPGDLPVEFPTQFPLTINLKTAKALGINIQPSLLSRADEVMTKFDLVLNRTTAKSLGLEFPATLLAVADEVVG